MDINKIEIQGNENIIIQDSSNVNLEFKIDQPEEFKRFLEHYFEPHFDQIKQLLSSNEFKQLINLRSEFKTSSVKKQLMKVFDNKSDLHLIEKTCKYCGHKILVKEMSHEYCVICGTSNLETYNGDSVSLPKSSFLEVTDPSQNKIKMLIFSWIYESPFSHDDVISELDFTSRKLIYFPFLVSSGSFEGTWRGTLKIKKERLKFTYDSEKKRHIEKKEIYYVPDAGGGIIRKEFEIVDFIGQIGIPESSKNLRLQADHFNNLLRPISSIDQDFFALSISEKLENLEKRLGYNIEGIGKKEAINQSVHKIEDFQFHPNISLNKAGIKYMPYYYIIYSYKKESFQILYDVGKGEILKDFSSKPAEDKEKKELVARFYDWHNASLFFLFLSFVIAIVFFFFFRTNENQIIFYWLTGIICLSLLILTIIQHSIAVKKEHIQLEKWKENLHMQIESKISKSL